MTLGLRLTVLSALMVIPMLAQSADSQAWQAAHPLTSVSVASTDSAGVYRVSVTVVDAQSSQVLANPILMARAGSPSRYQIGFNPGVSIRFTVTVNADGRTATYQSETLRDGQVQSGYIGTLYVQERS